MTGVTGLSFAPLVPWEAVAVLAAVSTLLLIFGMGRGARGCLVRLFVLAVLSLGLLNPHLERRAETYTLILHLSWWTAPPARMPVNGPLNVRGPWQPCGTVSQKFDDLEVRMVEGRETAEGTFYLAPSARLSRICREADMQVRSLSRMDRFTICQRWMKTV